MKLIFIHGRDQQGKDKILLKQIWIDTWKKGLAASNLVIPANLDIIFPYYGDVLEELVQKKGVPDSLEDVIQRGDVPDNSEAIFINELLMEIAENQGVSDAEIQQHFNGLPQEKGPLNWGWVQAILQTLDARTGFGNFSIKKFTYDVFLYLTIPAIAKKINDFIIQEMGNNDADGKCVVVGHSLGSIVGYNVLRNHHTLAVSKFITVGCPLGLGSVKKKLETPVMMPPGVANGWFNAYDDRDVVALEPLDERHFKIKPAIINKKNVDNGTPNRHGIEGYLNDPEVAKEIYVALTT